MAVALYQTPQNERSFSGLIDQVLTESGRMGALLSVVRFANATIRECQATGLFSRDVIEQVVNTSPADPGVTVLTNNQGTDIQWTRPPFFRALVAVRYMTQNYYPKYKMIGKGRLDNSLNSIDATQQFVYSADNYFILRGVIPGEKIGVAVRYWVKPLMYFARLGATIPGATFSTRQAYFDLYTDTWQYLNGAGTAYVSTTGDPVTDLVQQKLANHWIGDEWWDMIAEGTKAKLYKTYNDERAGAAFAIYQRLKDQFSLSVQTDAEASMHLGGEDI